MTETDLSQIDESIELLSSYHKRLEQEVIKISQKLQMPKAKINSTLEKHTELSAVKKALDQLIFYRDKIVGQIKNNSLSK